MALQTDIFGKTLQQPDFPFTADKAFIIINDQVVAGAQQIQIQYGQQPIKRREIGGKRAIVYTSQPQGSITMARLVAFFALPGRTGSGFPKFGTDLWSPCNLGTLKFEMHGGDCDNNLTNTTAYSFTATGCLITSYTIAAEAEGVSISEGVTMDFLQLLNDEAGVS